MIFHSHLNLECLTNGEEEDDENNNKNYDCVDVEYRNTGHCNNAGR